MYIKIKKKFTKKNNWSSTAIETENKHRKYLIKKHPNREIFKHIR